MKGFVTMPVVLRKHVARATHVGMSVGIAALLLVAGPATASASAVTVASPAAVSSQAVSASKKSVTQKFDAQLSESRKYMRTSPKGEVYFDLAAARAAKASPEILEIGNKINQLAAPKNAAANGMAVAQAASGHANLPVGGHVSPC